MRNFFCLLCVFLVLSCVALAQDRATITGSVVDQSGAVVPGAKIKVVHLATNVERTSEASAQGDYTIPQLPVGAYRVEISATGFKTLVRDNVVLTAGSTVRVDGNLTVGQVTDAVSVSAEAALLTTDTAKVSTAVTNRFVEDLPLVVGGQLRSPINLALIAPETKDTYNLSIGGGQEGGWDLTVDGISATPAAPFDQKLWTMINSPSVDAITEFSLDTNGYKAEFGHAGGGLMSFVSKSGTNELHGTGYEFLRNDALDANAWFNNALSKKKPVLKQSDFGGTIGGPLVIPKIFNGRNKVFFFGSYEGFRNRAGSTVAFQTIPLPEMYQGDFSNWKSAKGDLMPIYDPSTYRVLDNGQKVRDPFPGNKIPVGRFSQLSKNIIQYATMKPNQGDPSGILNPNPRNNYVVTGGGNVAPWDKMDVKMDFNPRPSDRVGVMFHWGQTLVNFLGSEPPGMPVPLNNFRNEDTNTKVYRVVWDHTFTPRLLNHLSVGINDWWQVKASMNSDQGWGTKIGIKNTPDPNKNFPGINPGGYTSWGREEWGGSLNKTWAGQDDLNYISGAHSFKFGFQFQEDHYNGYGQHTGTGGFDFSQGMTAVPGDQTNTSGNGFASFLLGQVSAARIQTLRFVSDQWRYYAGYAQDDWRASRKLTINYGVRYEYTPPTTEGYFPDGYNNLDPNLPNPGAGGRKGALVFAGTGEGRTGTRSLYPAWRWGISPRLGLAYSPDQKTVVRMSGSRSFAGMKNTGGSSHWQGFIGEFSWNSPDGINPAFNFDDGVPAWPKPPFLVPDFLNRNGAYQNSPPYWQQYDSGRLPEYYNLNFNMQRNLPYQLVAEIGYNAVLGHHLTTNLVKMNQMDPKIFYSYVNKLGFDAARNLMNSRIDSKEAIAAGVPMPYNGFPGSGSVRQALRPYPQYGDINTSGDGGDRSGNSTYHALIMKIEKRYSNGMQLLGSYVLSKMFSTAEGANASSNGSMDGYNLKLEKALSWADQTHQFKLNYSYELPFGKGKKYANSGIANYIVGGWRIAGVQTYASGTPNMVSPGYDLRIAQAGNRVSVADYNGWRATPKNGKFDPFADLWWNPSVMSKDPLDTAPSGAKVWVARTVFGNAVQRNPKERSPWNFGENISVARTFQFSERFRADFRWESFNLINRVRWGGPDSGLTSNNFGLVRSVGNEARRMQFGLKLFF